MLIVGVNSYVTLEEAREYVLGDKMYEKFLALSEEMQEYSLREAAERIDLLPLTGRKKSVMQSMAFPRDHQFDVPYQVKSAQVAEALAAIDGERSERQELQAQGVMSVTLGQVSESYSGSGAYYISLGLKSEKAYYLLHRYIAGSVAIV